MTTALMRRMPPLAKHSAEAMLSRWLTAPESFNSSGAFSYYICILGVFVSLQKEPKKSMEPYRVPTSGRFFLHDDRTADKEEEEDGEAEEPGKDGATRRKLPEGGDRWKHDRFEPQVRRSARTYPPTRSRTSVLMKWRTPPVCTAAEIQS
jgi:hypothetical protein